MPMWGFKGCTVGMIATPKYEALSLMCWRVSAATEVPAVGVEEMVVVAAEEEVAVAVAVAAVAGGHRVTAPPILIRIS